LESRLGREDNGHLGGSYPGFFRHIEAVHAAGKHHIQQNQVELFIVKKPQRRIAVIGACHLNTIVLKKKRDTATQ